MFLRKSTAHVDTKASSTRNKSQKGFWGIFVGIEKHQKGYFIYITSTRKIVSSYDIVFDKKILVRYYTCQVHIQRHSKRNQKSCTLRTLHRLMKKLVTL